MVTHPQKGGGWHAYLYSLYGHSRGRKEKQRKDMAAIWNWNRLTMGSTVIDMCIRQTE